jgi:hypothetical protein
VAREVREATTEEQMRAVYDRHVAGLREHVAPEQMRPEAWTPEALARANIGTAVAALPDEQRQRWYRWLASV